VAQNIRSKPLQGEKECINCHKTTKLSNYYLASNLLTSNDGKTVNVCKTCFKKGSLNKDGSINIEKFKEMLMLMDKPFSSKVLESSMAEVESSIEKGKGRFDILGCYMRQIQSLPQYSKLSFIESLSLPENTTKNSYSSMSTSILSTDKKRTDKKEKEVYVKSVDDFVVTDDLIDLFGEGYEKAEYKAMWKKYKFLKQNYTDSTNLHTEALITYVRFKVKEEMATALGDVATADKWSTAAMKAGEQAKLTPKSLTKADLQGGLNSFSELIKAVEQAVDIIPILPRFKFRPNDAIDFNIWCYINYIRNLEGKPECEYEDVYHFYDEKKARYIKEYGDPYGAFTDPENEDTSMKNRERVKNFIELPLDYNEEDIGGDSDG